MIHFETKMKHPKRAMLKKTHTQNEQTFLIFLFALILVHIICILDAMTIFTFRKAIGGSLVFLIHMSQASIYDDIV